MLVVIIYGQIACCCGTCSPFGAVMCTHLMANLCIIPLTFFFLANFEENAKDTHSIFGSSSFQRLRTNGRARATTFSTSIKHFIERSQIHTCLYTYIHAYIHTILCLYYNIVNRWIGWQAVGLTLHLGKRTLGNYKHRYICMWICL